MGAVPGLVTVGDGVVDAVVPEGDDRAVQLAGKLGVNELGHQVHRAEPASALPPVLFADRGQHRLQHGNPEPRQAVVGLRSRIGGEPALETEGHDHQIDEDIRHGPPVAQQPPIDQRLIAEIVPFLGMNEDQEYRQRVAALRLDLRDQLVDRFEVPAHRVGSMDPDRGGPPLRVMDGREVLVDGGQTAQARVVHPLPRQFDGRTPRHRRAGEPRHQSLEQRDRVVQTAVGQIRVQVIEFLGLDAPIEHLDPSGSRCLDHRDRRGGGGEGVREGHPIVAPAEVQHRDVGAGGSLEVLLPRLRIVEQLTREHAHPQRISVAGMQDGGRFGDRA